MDKKTTVLLLGLVLLVLGIGLGVVVGNQDNRKGACEGKDGSVYTIEIRDSTPSNPDVQGKPCDKITFTNYDKVTREIGFGYHDKHVPYDGISEKVIGQDGSFTITLNETGKFHWHDHFQDEVEGYFTISK